MCIFYTYQQAGVLKLVGFLQLRSNFFGNAYRSIWFEAATVVAVAPPVEIPAGSVLRSALAGGLACALSTSLMHPIDTIKANSLAQQLVLVEKLTILFSVISDVTLWHSILQCFICKGFSSFSLCLPDSSTSINLNLSRNYFKASTDWSAGIIQGFSSCNSWTVFKVSSLSNFNQQYKRD